MRGAGGPSRPEQGAPRGRPDDPTVVRIEVLPRERLLQRGASQQLAVIAHKSDGSTVDVTRMTQFESNQPELADVSATGLVACKELPGSAAGLTALAIGSVGKFAALAIAAMCSGFAMIARGGMAGRIAGLLCVAGSALSAVGLAYASARGLLGLGQPLKSFRDCTVDFAVYDRARFDRSYLEGLGPLEKPGRVDGHSMKSAAEERPGLSRHLI